MKIDSPVIIFALSSILGIQALSFALRLPTFAEPLDAAHDLNASSRTVKQGPRPDDSKENLLTPAELANLFFSSRSFSTANTAVVTDPVLVTPTLTETDHYVMVGAIENESGIKSVYLKHRETGRMIKARFDGTTEGGIRYYEKDDIEYIDINGRAHAIEKDRQ